MAKDRGEFGEWGLGVGYDNKDGCHNKKKKSMRCHNTGGGGMGGEG